MREIEAKVLDVDPDEVAETLAEEGVEQVYDGTMRTRFYDFPDGRIEDEGGVLRLRERGDDVFVTYKEPIASDAAKIMEETEFYVSDAAAAHTTLTAIGLEQVREREKRRTKWLDDDVEYVVDRYDGIPPLLEIEAPDVPTLGAACAALGYDPGEMVTWNAGQVMAHYTDS